jgi:transcriptional regulator with XRE-family HTH domain
MNNDLARDADIQKLGITLRALRIKRKWTLKDFESASGSQIKDVVLGSYERGSRAISVAKLMLIASVYEVPMSIFFGESHVPGVIEKNDQVIIDLRKLRETINTPCPEVICTLNNFVNGIIGTRRDWNGEILSLRKSDITYLAILTSQSVDQIIEEFRLFNVLFIFKD